jgi:hypothetical protein
MHDGFLFMCCDVDQVPSRCWELFNDDVILCRSIGNKKRWDLYDFIADMILHEYVCRRKHGFVRLGCGEAGVVVCLTILVFTRRGGRAIERQIGRVRRVGE